MRILDLSIVLLSVTLMSAAVGPASAANVYRCGTPQAPVYSDRPCVAGAEPLVVPAPNGMAPPRAPSTPKPDKAEADAARRLRQQNEAWLRDYAARREAEAALRKGVVESRVVPGMTPDQVERILNLPQARSQSGTTERWTYRNGNSTRIVVFRDGRVAEAGSGDGTRKQHRHTHKESR